MKKYIFTSSISAYNKYRPSFHESQFNPLNFTFEKKETVESNYGEAKRQAEVSFYRYANFPVTAVRFPIVLDENDAAMALNELSKNEFSGPINVASSKPIRLKGLVEEIEKVVGNKLVLADKKTNENCSPYNISEDWYVDCSQLEELGIKLSAIDNYLPKMIKSIFTKI